MRTTQVEVNLITVPVQPTFAWRNRLPGSELRLTGAWLRVITDNDLESEAFCKRGMISKDHFERRLRDDLIGQDVLKREYLWQRLWEIDLIEELSIYVSGIVDVALYNLAVQATGLPLHRLIGQYSNAIPAYASIATFNTTDEFLECASGYSSLGISPHLIHEQSKQRNPYP
jgi:L-alanine-DL-glutamate epimerase-like enolase superfamily enzyme